MRLMHGCVSHYNPYRSIWQEGSMISENPPMRLVNTAPFLTGKRSWIMIVNCNGESS